MICLVLLNEPITQRGNVKPTEIKTNANCFQHSSEKRSKHYKRKFIYLF